MKRRDFLTKGSVVTAVGLGAAAVLSGCDQGEKEKKEAKAPAVQKSKKQLPLFQLGLETFQVLEHQLKD